MNPHQKARITWRCRRGMLELDLILDFFIKHHLDTLNEKQLENFENLLHEPDPDLYSWFMGYDSPKDDKYREIIELIRSFDTIR